MQKRPMADPTTQSQPASPPSAGIADCLLGSLTVLRDLLSSTSYSTLGDVDMVVMIENGDKQKIGKGLGTREAGEELT